MSTYSLVSAWTDLCQQLFPIFTQPTAHVFLRLVTGWVLCTGRRTITGIIPFADPGRIRSHDTYHRFFSKAVWDPERLWELLARLLVRMFYPTGPSGSTWTTRCFITPAGRWTGRASGGTRSARRSRRSSIAGD